MVVAFLAGLLAVASAAVSVAAVREYVRGRRALAGRRIAPAPAPAPVTAVAVGDRLSTDLLRAVAVAEMDARVSLRVGGVPGDPKPAAALDGARRDVPAMDATLILEPPPPRHVPGAWLEARLVDPPPEGISMFLDPSARPSARQLRPFARAPWADGPRVAVACPTPAPSVRGMAAARIRVFSDLTPILFAVAPAGGFVPVAVAATSGAVAAALADPLARNRSSFGAAVLARATAGDTRLLPLPMSVAAEAADLIREQAMVVARASAFRTALVVAWLLAVPCAFAAAVLAPAGPAHSWALAALGLAAASRLTVAATWSRAVRGPGPAVLAWVLSPVRDLLAAAGLVVAALGRHVTKNGARFRVRGGGTLAPATQPHGAGL